MSPTKQMEDKWWKHLGNWVQLALGFVSLASIIGAGVLWASDQRYVQHPELAAAIENVKEHVDAGNKAEKVSDLESEILDLQDDIVFFSEEGSETSVKRRCRKLPRVIQSWEAEKEQPRQKDPIVVAACESISNGS